MDFFTWIARRKRRRSSSIMISEAVPELPFEIITEILSWLPVKSLVRFKCACKQWRSLLLDYNFIAKHMLRARPLRLSYQQMWEPNRPTYFYSFDENFERHTSVAGLFLESSLTSRAFRIRNFATRQVLYLPDVHNAAGRLMMSFVFDSSTGESKVAYFYKNEEDEVGVKVLSIGKDNEWRTLKLSNQNNKGVLRRYVFRALPNVGVTDLVETIRVGEDLKLGFISFDVWSECFTINTLPQGVFADSQRVSFLRWENSVAVADIVEEALYVLVLHDFKKHKWSKITVPLKFLKDNSFSKDQIKPRIGTTSKIWFNYGVRNVVFQYDVKREMIISFIIRTESTEKKLQKETFVKPSLVTLKGMKLEY